MKLEKETQKAIIRIPKELAKLTRVLAFIGETLFGLKAIRIEKNKKKLQKIFEEKEPRSGVT
jgi:hypothetical protein